MTTVEFPTAAAAPAGAPRTRDELAEAIARDGIEFLFAMFVDLHGKPCAKLIPVSALDSFLAEGAGFAGYAAGPMGQSPADPDLAAMPDLSSYTPLPWQPGLAVLQCDPYVDGSPWPYAPRVILRRALDRLAADGMVFNVGAEPEYFLVRRRPDGGIEVADPLDNGELPCYDAKGLTRVYEHLTQVSRGVNALGWANYANDHEDGNGQFEQNFRYADALVTADRLVIFRYAVHMLAQRAGMTATFMPKPFAGRTGSGMHVHASLWSTAGEELFLEPDDPHGLGLSRQAYAFLAGVLDHAPGLAAITCPTVNSYKRIGAPTPRSGATWAPAFISYGGNNRTQMIRVPAPGRMEVRAVDGSANPYLAFTAILAAGLDGLARGADPGEPNRDNLFALPPAEIAARGIRTLPPTLYHATDALLADPVLVAGLGEVPDGTYAEYFAGVKRDEFFEYHAQVTPWEVDHYLTLF
jgi:glutamine synthetase